MLYYLGFGQYSAYVLTPPSATPPLWIKPTSTDITLLTGLHGGFYINNTSRYYYNSCWWKQKRRQPIRRQRSHRLGIAHSIIPLPQVLRNIK
ncbi:hypothetical protein Ciccas_014573 [Cichlidogyrus casuarinus]|uniref:Uncharacterized protein n=1 Tax=Cichlidogyrus casuarinus TaxID=1844966 RepID=A0ABD2PIZ6_9PLAT